MKHINRLLAAVLSLSLAVPASAVPVEKSAPTQIPVGRSAPKLGVPELPAASMPTQQVQAADAAANDAVIGAAAAITPEASRLNAALVERIEAATPVSDEAALKALPGPIQTRFAEADAAFPRKTDEAVSADTVAKIEAALPKGAALTGRDAALSSVATKKVDDKAAAAAQRSKQGPIYQEINGQQRPMGYNPALPVTPLWKEILEYVRHPILRVRQIFEYRRRVREYMKEVTDEDLSWSLSRFPEFEKQEGILRHSNRDLINDWKKWTSGSLMLVTPADFDSPLMSRISIRKIFKQAMDREEPTLSYQATSAHELHDYMHSVAHFMGVTMQERVISIALTGNPPQESVWAAEEKRHGNIMERVYNFSRPLGAPELKEQGIAPTTPDGGEYEARSMIANRALAEIGAGTAYLLLKSNARKGSPADIALEGIFRDEVYHYVLMEAARKWGFGHPDTTLNRLKGLARFFGQIAARTVGFKRVKITPLNQYWGLERLLNIGVHYNDNQLPDAVDSIVDERGGFSPLAIFQVAAGFAAIHFRVDAYLKTIPDEQGQRAIGKVYQSEAEFEAAVARGEQTRTDPYKVEQNPELTGDEIRELARRFPGRFNVENRSVKASQIRGMLTRYRELLASQNYWQRKKGFKLAPVNEGFGDNTIMREYPDGKVYVEFPMLPTKGAEPIVTVLSGQGKLLQKPLSALTMKQFGVLFADAAPTEAKKGMPGLTQINLLGADFTPAEIVARLAASKAYRAEPLPLIAD